jgi:hypothetical protein
MDPVIKNSDIVVCRPLEGMNEVRDNEIYTVTFGRVCLGKICPENT